MVQVAIVDYGLANIRSVANAFDYFGADVRVAEEGSDLAGAERVVLPGVGSFDAGMRELRARGHEPVLRDLVLDRGLPYLGICLGMQFLMEGSEEGQEPGLGWVSGRCAKFPSGNGHLPVPHIGWNETRLNENSDFFDGIDEPADFYFVHSYFVPCGGEADGLQAANCEYGTTFVAALARDNIWACQFHPEKSQMAGMKIIENFLGQEPAAG